MMLGLLKSRLMINECFRLYVSGSNFQVLRSRFIKKLILYILYKKEKFECVLNANLKVIVLKV